MTLFTPPHLLSPHRQQKYDAMVQKILATAREIMREQGVAALSMQELARRMNLRAPSLYNYFSSKQEIYDTLFRLGFSHFGAGWKLLSQGGPSLNEYLERCFEYYLGFARQNPELFQLCFERPVPGFVPSQESLEVSQGLLQLLRQQALQFEEIKNSGLPAEQVADLVIAMMHGITALHMANEPEKPVAESRFGSLIPAALALFQKPGSLDFNGFPFEKEHP